MAPIGYAEMPIPRLQLLNEEGGVVREIPIEGEQLVVGRTAGDVTFDDDDALSPEHALLTWRENALTVRDLGSANGSWLFITTTQTLADGDVLLIGSQVVRFRRLPAPATGNTGDHRPAAPARLPVVDDAMLEQLRPDGTIRNVLYLSPGRTFLIGREHGNWVFPYDPTMSARHAEILSHPEDDTYAVRDLGSRNGVAVQVRGERGVRGGERLLLGRKMLRVDLA
ncbi:MAG TPA: FHA domain-containing protein [Gemmatimonadaceae bacterium]|nr:FHA domain-containing protein [Gemmatimonadaceae bacterium]